MTIHYNAQDNGFYLQCNATTIAVDLTQIPANNSSCLIITHLKTETLSLLQKELTIPIYLSQDLFWLLQKLARFSFINLAKQEWKILPYGYFVELGDFKIQALKSDDGLFGACSLLLIDKQQHTIGYCGVFFNHGTHKKRIKAWKKVFAQSSLEHLILVKNKQIMPLSTELSENNIQKSLLKFLNHTSKQETSAIFSPWSPERLLRYQKTAMGAGWQIIWQKDFAQFLAAFYPFEEFLTTPSFPTKRLYQVAQPRFKQDTEVFIDPVITAFVNEPIELADLQASLVGLNDSELKEFINYLKPKELHYCN